MTPEAASNPKAEPPASTTACTRWTRAVEESRSVSRVPGAPPRTSTPAVAPPRHSTTVQPVRALSVLGVPDLDSRHVGDGAVARSGVRHRRRAGSLQVTCQLQELLPLLAEEMDRDVVQFQMKRGLPIRFLGLPCHVILGLSQGLVFPVRGGYWTLGTPWGWRLRRRQPERDARRSVLRDRVKNRRMRARRCKLRCGGAVDSPSGQGSRSSILRIR